MFNESSQTKSLFNLVIKLTVSYQSNKKKLNFVLIFRLTFTYYFRKISMNKNVFSSFNVLSRLPLFGGKK